MVPSPLFVGIDVAKATLDIAVRPTAETWSVSNDATGIDALVLRLGAWAPTLIVLEATGGSQGPLVAALVAAALPVVVVNPRHIRACAQAVGILATTDRIDARVIAHFAEAVKPAPRPLPDAETHLAVGDRVEILPIHVCVWMDLQPEVYGVRNGQVVERIAVEAMRHSL